MNCTKHPKYNGLKKPTNECVECLSVYVSKNQFRPERVPTAKAGMVEKDKSKYTRKSKHKKTID